MRELAFFDRKDYDENWKIDKREAVRCIIVRNGKVALVKSTKEGYYKFPGGGKHADENYIAALKRETLEETGLTIDEKTVREFGYVRELRKSLYDDNVTFAHTSYYFFADITDEKPHPLQLDDYEKDLGFVLEWADAKSAFDNNKVIQNNYATKFMVRETFVLGLLCGENE